MELARKIDQITMIATIVAILLLVVVGGGFAYYWYVTRIKKRGREQEDLVNYDTFVRKDSKNYPRFEDIHDDMIITDNGRRFIGVITCRGFDFYSAHAAERYNAQSGFRAFVNTINKPITYRQYTKPVDMAHTLELYKENLDRVTEQLFEMNQNYNEMKRSLNQMRKELGDDKALEDEGFVTLVNTMDQLQRQMNNMDWRRLHIEDQISYIHQISEDYAPPSPSETYVFDWYYNPLDFPMDLTEEQIIDRAKQELYKIGNAKIHALSGAGVKARRCTTNELIEMCRRHMNPKSSERYRMDDVNNSTFFDDISGTDKENELFDLYKEETTEELQINLTKALSNMKIPMPEQPLTNVEDLAFEQVDGLEQEKQKVRIENEMRQDRQNKESIGQSGGRPKTKQGHSKKVSQNRESSPKVNNRTVKGENANDSQGLDDKFEFDL